MRSGCRIFFDNFDIKKKKYNNNHHKKCFNLTYYLRRSYNRHTTILYVVTMGFVGTYVILVFGLNNYFLFLTHVLQFYYTELHIPTTGILD